MDSLPTTYSGPPIRIAIIGGTGISSLPNFKPVATLTLSTPWGSPSSPVTVLSHPSPTHPGTSTSIAFLARHGPHHHLAPHEVPARANIAALRSLGVRTIIAFSAVGSLQAKIKPRDFVIPNQIIDRTKGIRPFTFFEDGIVAHVPFADPFDESVSALVRKCGHSLQGEGVVLHDGGTLVCMEGPAFSTRAESNLYRSWGGDVINMSALPEAKLAREAELAYVMICMSTDYDCWHTEGESVSVEMVMGHMKANAENAKMFVAAVLDELCKEENKMVVEAKGVEGMAKMCLTTSRTAVGAEARKRIEWLFPGYLS